MGLGPAPYLVVVLRDLGVDEMGRTEALFIGQAVEKIPNRGEEGEPGRSLAEGALAIAEAARVDAVDPANIGDHSSPRPGALQLR